MTRRLSRLLLWLGLATGLAPPAAAAPRIEWSAVPAWQGWSRPDRVTELDIRLAADAATAATLELRAGAQVQQVAIDLQPARPLRLRLSVPAAPVVTLQLDAPGGPALRRDVVLARSESPLLALALSAAGTLQVGGFHVVPVAAADLPRQAAAHAGIDALVIDAPTLAALDSQQLAALLGHASACGRIVVMQQDPRVRRMLDSAAGCGGQAMLHAADLADAALRLEASLDRPLAGLLVPADLGDALPQPERLVWQRVVLMVAAGLAAFALTLLFTTSLPVLLALGVSSAGVAVLLQRVLPAPAQLVIWSEAVSGDTRARYQARQQLPGVARGSAQVPIADQLAPSVQACRTTQDLHLQVDPSTGQAMSAAFETRLFGQVALCYAGSFPIQRAVALQGEPGADRQVRNSAAMAWPAGLLLADARVQDLPAMAAGAQATLPGAARREPRSALERAALSRIGPEAGGALWELDLSGVARLPEGARGWLVMTAVDR